MKQFNVGDKVWMIRTFDEIYWKDQNNIPKDFVAKVPMQKKITQITELKDGTFMYGVKGGHFHDNWIGSEVFVTKEDAMNAIMKKLVA